MEDAGLGIAQNAHLFLKINSLCFLLLTFVNTTRFLIQGIGFARAAVFAGLLEMVGRALIALRFVPQFGFAAVCFASPAAWLFADFFLVPLFYICVRRLEKRFPKQAM